VAISSSAESQEPVPRGDKGSLYDRIRSAPGVVVKLATSIGLLAGAGWGVIQIVDHFSHHQPPPILFSSDQLSRIVNSRYGFVFSYPSTWNRADPANSDGYTFSNPDRSAVSFAAYGSHGYLVRDTSPTAGFFTEQAFNLRKQVDFELADNAKLPKYKLHQSVEAGMLLLPNASSSDTDGTAIPGWRLFYEYTDESTHSHVAVLERIAYQNGSTVTIRLQVPVNQTGQWQNSL
jgi:hypothetical protein